MAMKSAHVVAVVLNWNGTERTLRCVSSLVSSDWPRLTTLVVDNGSREDITAAVRERFPESVVIRNGENLGFAGGMNVGLRRAQELGADFVLLLNNDTVVDRSMVSVLVQAALERPRAGIVCPLVFASDRPDVILSAGLRCDLRRGYQGAPLGQGERDEGQFAGVPEIDAPSGAAMLVPVRVLDAVGLLDGELFLYGEDVDWAMRMRAAGFGVFVASAARVWHGLSSSSGGGGSPMIGYYLTRNSLTVCSRHAPLRRPRAFLRAAEIVLVMLVHARRTPKPVSYARAVIGGWLDYLRGRSGPAPVQILARA